ncbi:Thymidylate kinase [hydrothermal vent metagenome]|uniref:dTMP kinase n=1 Tax=hydrothermal vent metagenome TaxID=652676 RepID=A0A3B0ZTW3_9ZZZZ
MRGKFITIEGGEGVGKTTNMEFITKYLVSKSINHIVTREPGGTDLGELLREIMLDPKQSNICSDSELLLMFAARAQHLQQKIIPALEKGCWVVCDRFTDATYAYQGGGRGIDFSRIAILEEWVQGHLRPDLTILFDMPVELGMARAVSRSDPDRFEQEKLDFFERVRTSYRNIALKNTSQYKIIDASKNLQDVQSQILIVLDSF